jgi:hypothetical protein
MQGGQVRKQGGRKAARAKDKEKDSRTERHQYDTAQNKKDESGVQKWGKMPRNLKVGNF